MESDYAALGVICTLNISSGKPAMLTVFAGPRKVPRCAAIVSARFGRL